MRFLKDKKNVNTLRLVLLAITIGMAFILSCAKSGSNPPPVAVWEDNSSDSASLNLTVQSAQGQILVNQYVNLALSTDSLNAGNLVRKTATNSAGVAVFRKLYPRIIYFNCVAVTSTQTFYGSGKVRLLPGMVKDTILTVH